MIDMRAGEGWLPRPSCHHGEMLNFLPEWWEMSLSRFCTGIYIMGQKGHIKTWHWILAKIYLIYFIVPPSQSSELFWQNKSYHLVLTQMS